MRKIILSLIFLLFPPLLLAAELPEYPTYQLREAPILDGRITEEAWDHLPAVTGLFIFGGSHALEKQTSFQAGWTEKALYIAVKAVEPEPEKMVVGLKFRENPWIDDSMEIFLFPKKAGNYFQFIVNTIGSRWNGIGDFGALPRPLWDWQAKTYTGKDFWSLEVRIPFPVLGGVPENKERWPANIARNILTGPSEERFTTWAPLGHVSFCCPGDIMAGVQFHEAANFGAFIFKEKTLSPQEAKEIERALNVSYYNFLKDRVSELAKSAPVYREIIEKGTKNPRLQPEANSLQEIWELLETLSREKEPDLEELIPAVAKSAHLLERTRILESEVLMGAMFE